MSRKTRRVLTDSQWQRIAVLVNNVVLWNRSDRQGPEAVDHETVVVESGAGGSQTCRSRGR